MKNVHFKSFPSSFSPTSSCFHFLQFLLSISNPLLCLRDKWRKTSLDPKKTQAWGRFPFSLFAGERDQGLCARGGRESLCARSCTTAGSEDPRVSLSPSFPHTSQNAQMLQLPTANCPQQACRPAGKEKHRLEDLLHTALTALWQVGAGPALQRCSLGLEPVDTDQQSTSMFLAVGPRGTPVLCCVRLDNLILY